MLRAYGLPVPQWRLVRTIDELPNLLLEDTKYGWTIRTIRTDSKPEIGGFFLNHASVGQILMTLADRLGRYAPEEAYIVYASWSPVAFVNIICDGDTLRLEGVFGELNTVARGLQNADFTLEASRFSMREGVDHLPHDVRSGLKRVMKSCRKLPFRRFYAEAALIEDHRIMFYELFGIGGRLVRLPG